MEGFALKSESTVASCPWREMGLKDHEYRMIVEKLGREPNYTELGMFAVLWSEHCAYKHSRAVLRGLPTEGSRVLVGPGENAGVLDIGDGLAVAFKMESHNHPCAVEPFQGAATGVGGIVRDILAMGARPIALFDPLRFGPPDDPRSAFLFQGVVSGISFYGNCLGIPTVGGEVEFSRCYRSNPLCNVMCLGIMRHDEIFRGRASGPGNLVMIVGHSTGRDGIHGCTFASEELARDSESKRPNVQVGDPFMEKLLIEACLEMMRTGAVIGIQDMGAAGITSSCAETAARAGTGMEIEIRRIPTREEGMTPYEVMLSESQERMLLIVAPDKAPVVEEIARKWGLCAAVIGKVTDTGDLVVKENGVEVARIPAKLLAEGAPVYQPASSKPRYLRETSSFEPDSLPMPSLSEAAFKVIGAPNIASKALVWRQYDYMVRTDTVAGPGSGAAVLRVKGTRKGIVVSTDGNGRITYLNPRAGGMWAVVESALNVAVTGARPLGITNCLNFGNPEDPEVFWQFKEAVAGMGEACRRLGTPVTGGNVSFYNETEGEAIYPTPVVGMVGLLEDIEKRVSPWFKTEGDMVAVIGEMPGDPSHLAGSEYLERCFGLIAGKPPEPDLGLARNLIEALVRGAENGLYSSATDVSQGGIFTALAESSFGSPGHLTSSPDVSGTEIEISLGKNQRLDAVLFGEGVVAAVVSFPESNLREVAALARSLDLSLTVLGRVKRGRITVRAREGSRVRTVVDLETRALRDTWSRALVLS
ncbi:MAG: phosphoribosylformylglycinamidine synthase subunit PurL [Firmicutes bacterium]|nr:phosphoribosylformylglycinamidine synthase subunit PurL [Candidatus Fermentithermobacillaceae bacterium]